MPNTIPANIADLFNQTQENAQNLCLFNFCNMVRSTLANKIIQARTKDKSKVVYSLAEVLPGRFLSLTKYHNKGRPHRSLGCTLNNKRVIKEIMIELNKTADLSVLYAELSDLGLYVKLELLQNDRTIFDDDYLSYYTAHLVISAVG